MADRPKRAISPVVYPSHVLRQGLLSFLELSGFWAEWVGLGLDDDDLQALEAILLDDPKRHAVIAGTGGLRKARFRSRRSHRGKSGGVRVCYCHLERHGMILLVKSYTHAEQDNLSAAEKQAVKKLIATIDAELDRRMRRPQEMKEKT